MLSAPEPLAHHNIDAFDSGVSSLDDWLKRRATQNQASGASRTFVVCDNNTLVAYYALASSAIAPAATQGRFRRNMPDPIPVVVLTRLAISRLHPGKGLLVHAISEEAKAFHSRLGLELPPIERMTLMTTVGGLRAAPTE